ncbi:MAG TPA: universal stress protein [Gemmatimonadales bacterium]|nr:universal stress protein [Gemmatimonadales bacterium]
MTLHRIVVAVDESDAGRWAARGGLDLAAKAGAELAVVRAVPMPSGRVLAGAGAPAVAQPPGVPRLEVERLSRWLAPELPGTGGPRVGLAITCGVPSIEICRYAEESGASLVVLGRKHRSVKTRLLIGDTADAVARRSRLPCLFVPSGAPPMRRILAALDGTDRGLEVLVAANRLATAVGAELLAVTVESTPSGEPAAGAPLLARSAVLAQRLRQTLGRDHPNARLEVRRGSAVEQILAAVEATGADTLAVGYHRGGPAGIIEARSTGRRLLHAAPGAVLTIPL